MTSSSRSVPITTPSIRGSARIFFSMSVLQDLLPFHRDVLVRLGLDLTAPLERQVLPLDQDRSVLLQDDRRLAAANRDGLSLRLDRDVLLRQQRVVFARRLAVILAERLGHVARDGHL